MLRVRRSRCASRVLSPETSVICQCTRRWRGEITSDIAVGRGERANRNSHPGRPARRSPGRKSDVLAARLATLCCPRQAEQRLHGFRVATQSGFKSRKRSGLVPSEHLIERGVGIDDGAVGLGDDLRFVRSVGGGLEQICRRQARADANVPGGDPEEQEHSEHRQKGDDGQQQRLARTAGEQSENDGAGGGRYEYRREETAKSFRRGQRIDRGGFEPECLASLHGTRI